MEIISLLPYSILLLAAVIALFLEGNIVNKIINLAVFAAGIFCICAESGWWRFGFILAVGLACGSRPNKLSGSKGAPCYFAMAIGLMLMIIAKWAICSVLSILFGYLDPTWVLVLISLLFSYMLIMNVGCNGE